MEPHSVFHQLMSSKGSLERFWKAKLTALSEPINILVSQFTTPSETPTQPSAEPPPPPSPEPPTPSACTTTIQAMAVFVAGLYFDCGWSLM